MRCEYFDKRLHQLLDLRRPPEADSALLAHASICCQCHETLCAQEALFDGLDLFCGPLMSEEFTGLVIAEVRKRQRRNQNLRRVALFSGLAASVALIAMSFINQSMKSSDTPPLTAPLTSLVDESKPIGPAPNTGIVQTQPSWRLNFPELTPARREHLTHIATDGLRPITGSFSIAIGALRNTLPIRNKSDNEPERPQAAKPVSPRSRFA